MSSIQVPAIYKVEDGQNISVAELSPGLDNFVIDEQGRFFVTSFADGFVKRVNTDKSVTELQPGGMAHAGGVAYFQGNVVAADLHAFEHIKQTGTKLLFKGMCWGRQDGRRS